MHASFFLKIAKIYIHMIKKKPKNCCGMVKLCVFNLKNGDSIPPPQPQFLFSPINFSSLFLPLFSLFPFIPSFYYFPFVFFSFYSFFSFCLLFLYFFLFFQLLSFSFYHIPSIIFPPIYCIFSVYFFNFFFPSIFSYYLLISILSLLSFSHLPFFIYNNFKAETGL